ncbi:MAG: L-alanine-DL-glutamate epimerase [Bacteroidales bacterium]|nr:L-alanine-DL-glutamate epimerase [Bacteroidales bacterium]
MNRREFARKAGIVAAGFGAFQTAGLSGCTRRHNTIEIISAKGAYEREPLIRPFGFKGGYMTEIWQTAAMLESAGGIKKTGVCTQNVLWSDAGVFAANSEEKGNELMYDLTVHALKLVTGARFKTPVDLLESIIDELLDYGRKATGKADLRKTFVLNSLVGVDNAAWLLYAAENRIGSFDEMIPEEYRAGLSNHHDKIASIPLMAYSIPVEEIRAAVDEGYFFMKIKIGQPGTQEEMLQKDMERLTAIHDAIGGAVTPWTSDGRLPYYFDANGRYEKKETLLRLLDHARSIGAFDQIAIIEEPFPEEAEIDISDIPVRIAADESAHTDTDALDRISRGYRAIALKAIAKTLSMTLKIIKVAREHNIPCFCADLTVNPLLVEWNKNVAARLDPFPGLGLGLLETNGHQNYSNWEAMRNYHPYPSARWSQTHNGLFELDDDYYLKSGGIFAEPKHFTDLINGK